MKIQRFFPLVFAAAVAVGVASLAVNGTGAEKDAQKIRVLIIDGENNHNWKDTTPFLKEQLEATGRFEVSVATTPPRGAGAEDWAGFKPDFDSVDVVLSNYNGPMWEPAGTREAFEAFLEGGGALVNVHAANNAARGWVGFEEATGLLWRGSKDGARVYLDEVGKLMRLEPGDGPGAGHGPQHEYVIKVRQTEHPIMQGMPNEWLHTRDELYHGQRGPAPESMEILATAFSAPDKKGTGVHEPMVWWIPVGEGKVVTNVLGHVGKSDTKEMVAMRCVGFLTLVARSCEWAVMDEVTIPVPDNFPTRDAVSVVE